MRCIAHMSVKAKLIVSSLVFSLPIAVLLYSVVAGIGADIAFSSLEKSGNSYQARLAGIMQALTGRVAAQALGGDASAKTAETDAAFAALVPVQAAQGEELQVTPQGLGSRGRDGLSPEKLAAAWKTARSQAGPQGAAEASGLLAQVRALAGHVGDTSNLILDPDLDSYYLMDVTLLALPQTQERLAALMAEAPAVLAKEQWSLHDRIWFAVQARLLAEADQARIATSIATALAEDDNFYGRRESMHRVLPPALDGYERANRELTGMLERLADAPAADVSAERLLAAGLAASQASFALWSAASGELDGLLQVRLGHYASQRTLILALTAVALAVALGTVFLSGVSILTAIRAQVGHAACVADGDLDARAEGDFSPEFRRLRDAIEKMVGNLKSQMRDARSKEEEALAAKRQTEAALLRSEEQQKLLDAQRREVAEVGANVSRLAERVAQAAKDLSASADEQARGAGRQKEQAEAVFSAVTQMTDSVIEVARNASSTAQAAEDATRTAHGGSAMVREAVSSIDGVATAAHKLAAVLGSLDGQSGEIGRIIGVINDIADQTNLLALNAAIEAARAGDAGRGFAVVADEVRKLAEKTMTATKEVGEAIRRIQDGSLQAVASMDETRRQVEASIAASTRAGRSLEDIQQGMEDMNRRIAQIAAAAEQQSATAEQISSSEKEIAVIAGRTEQGAAKAARATHDLAELSQELLSLVVRLSHAAA